MSCNYGNRVIVEEGGYPGYGCGGGYSSFGGGYGGGCGGYGQPIVETIVETQCAPPPCQAYQPPQVVREIVQQAPPPPVMPQVVERVVERAPPMVVERAAPVVYRQQPAYGGCYQGYGGLGAVSTLGGFGGLRGGFFEEEEEEE